MKIITEFYPPPIPTRSFDWSAIFEGYDGTPDSPNRDLMGFGSTEEEAIRNLKEQAE